MPCKHIGMDSREWDRRHREADSARRATRCALDPAAGDLVPARLVAEVAETLAVGKALDLACGRGRNAVWLSRKGWDVTAVDGSVPAIEMLRHDAERLGLRIDTHVANLEKHEFLIPPSVWDLILICKYFQPDLYAPAIRGLAPGGVMVATALLVEPGKERYRVRPGEFESYFAGLRIAHSKETKSDTPEGHSKAEIVAAWESHGNNKL